MDLPRKEDGVQLTIPFEGGDFGQKQPKYKVETDLYKLLSSEDKGVVHEFQKLKAENGYLDVLDLWNQGRKEDIRKFFYFVIKYKKQYLYKQEIRVLKKMIGYEDLSDYQMTILYDFIDQLWAEKSDFIVLSQNKTAKFVSDKLISHSDKEIYSVLRKYKLLPDQKESFIGFFDSILRPFLQPDTVHQFNLEFTADRIKRILGSYFVSNKIQPNDDDISLLIEFLYPILQEIKDNINNFKAIDKNKLSDLILKLSEDDENRHKFKNFSNFSYHRGEKGSIDNFLFIAFFVDIVAKSKDAMLFDDFDDKKKQLFNKYYLLYYLSNLNIDSVKDKFNADQIERELDKENRISGYKRNFNNDDLYKFYSDLTDITKDKSPIYEMIKVYNYFYFDEWVNVIYNNLDKSKDEIEKTLRARLTKPMNEKINELFDYLLQETIIYLNDFKQENQKIKQELNEKTQRERVENFVFSAFQKIFSEKIKKLLDSKEAGYYVSYDEKVDLFLEVEREFEENSDYSEYRDKEISKELFNIFVF